MHGNDIRYVSEWEKWIIWDGTRWKIDTGHEIEAKAKEVSKQIWNEYASAKDFMGDSEKKRPLLNTMKSFAKSSSNASGIRNMLMLTRSENDISIDYDKLDRNEWVLTMLNGTVDLKTGQLGLHDRSNYCTMLCPVAYDPLAICPLWHQFLQDITCGDQQLIQYLQRLVGYSLTGSTKERILPFLYGRGDNGKSIFTNIILKLLGSDYGMKAAPDLLMSKGGETHPTDRADEPIYLESG